MNVSDNKMLEQVRELTEAKGENFSTNSTYRVFARNMADKYDSGSTLDSAWSVWLAAWHGPIEVVDQLADMVASGGHSHDHTGHKLPLMALGTVSALRFPEKTKKALERLILGDRGISVTTLSIALTYRDAGFEPPKKVLDALISGKVNERGRVDKFVAAMTISSYSSSVLKRLLGMYNSSDLLTKSDILLSFSMIDSYHMPMQVWELLPNALNSGYDNLVWSAVEVAQRLEFYNEETSKPSLYSASAYRRAILEVLRTCNDVPILIRALSTVKSESNPDPEGREVVRRLMERHSNASVRVSCCMAFSRL